MGYLWLGHLASGYLQNSTTAPPDPDEMSTKMELVGTKNLVVLDMEPFI